MLWVIACIVYQGYEGTNPYSWEDLHPERIYIYRSDDIDWGCKLSWEKMTQRFLQDAIQNFKGEVWASDEVRGGNPEFQLTSAHSLTRRVQVISSFMSEYWASDEVRGVPAYSSSLTHTTGYKQLLPRQLSPVQPTQGHKLQQIVPQRTA